MNSIRQSVSAVARVAPRRAYSSGHIDRAAEMKSSETWRVASIGGVACVGIVTLFYIFGVRHARATWRGARRTRVACPHTPLQPFRRHRRRRRLPPPPPPPPASPLLCSSVSHARLHTLACVQCVCVVRLCETEMFMMQRCCRRIRAIARARWWWTVGRRARRRRCWRRRRRPPPPRHIPLSPRRTRGAVSHSLTRCLFSVL